MFDGHGGSAVAAELQKLPGRLLKELLARRSSFEVV